LGLLFYCYREAGFEGALLINCDEQEQFIGRGADSGEAGAPNPAPATLRLALSEIEGLAQHKSFVLSVFFGRGEEKRAEPFDCAQGKLSRSVMV
jgi:hypothetical protein